MKPMYLPQVEDPAGARGAYTSILQAMAAGGGPVSQIWYMFAFKPQATDHLLRLTQEVMRGPSPLSPGLRERQAGEVPRAFVPRSSARG